jgi:hypothetical protein
MGVAAGGCQAGVADRRLHQMRRCTAVESVADMGMAQPVGGNCRREAGPLGGPLDDAMHLGRIQQALIDDRSVAATLA